MSFKQHCSQLSEGVLCLKRRSMNSHGLLLKVGCGYLKYVFWRPIFQTPDWALPLAPRGGYVAKDKINGTIIMVIMRYQWIGNKMVTFDIGMLYIITNVHLSSISIIGGYMYNDSLIQYNTTCQHHRRPVQIILIWNKTWMVRSLSFFSMLHWI